MISVMGDAEHVNVAQLKKAFPKLDRVGLYVTGTPDVKATETDLALWPDATVITIDQGGPGSPVKDAIVRDVEPRCWSAAAAVDTSEWTAERPTIYCDRNDLPTVINLGWRGDVWLAWPGYTGMTAPVFPGVRVVAVQRTTTEFYDLTTVFDDTWPFKRIQEAEMLNVQVQASQKAHIPFPVGSFTAVHIYRDFLSAAHTADVRVAFHSQTSGYIAEHIDLNSAEPHVIQFTHPDIDAVSIENDSPLFEIGATLV